MITVVNYFLLLLNLIIQPFDNIEVTFQQVMHTSDPIRMLADDTMIIADKRFRSI